MEDLSKHSSQVDAAKGFGGKYGVQKDRVDKVYNMLGISHFTTDVSVLLNFFSSNVYIIIYINFLSG